MTIENHSLINEFPEMREQVRRLKISNTHFQKLFCTYDAIEHEVQKIEQAGINTSDDYLEELRKKRLKVKDELFAMLKKAV